MTTKSAADIDVERPGRELLVALYATMLRIRAFEERIRGLFRSGDLPGFVHLSIGQEATAVGTCSTLSQADRITTTHRGHGHVIAKGADVSRMMAEVLGRAGGLCKGKGGSMHLCDLSLGILGANGIVGGGIPMAAGSAFAQRRLDTGGITVTFFGEGAVSEGTFAETLNLATSWKLPLVFVCEANGWVEWTKASRLVVGEIVDRALPYGIPGVAVDGNDVLATREAVARARDRARAGDGPSLIVAETYRMTGHNEGEEAYTGSYRDEGEVNGWAEKDPIELFGRRLVSQFGVAEADLADIRRLEDERLDRALEFATQSTVPPAETAFEDLYA